MRQPLRMPPREAAQNEPKTEAPPVAPKLVDSITIAPSRPLSRPVVARTFVEDTPEPVAPPPAPTPVLTEQTLAEMEAGRASIAKFQAHNQASLDARQPPKKNEQVAVDPLRIENFSHTANVTSTTKK